MIPFFLLLFAFLCENSHGITLTKTCSNGIDVFFTLEVVTVNAQNRYRLTRDPKASDVNCEGTLSFIGADGNDGGNDDNPNIVELGSKVFQDLPNVDKIEIVLHSINFSSRSIYNGSPKIQTIIFRNNFFPRLDAAVSQFPEGLKSLDFTEMYYFGEIKSEFFTFHSSLTELIISDPQGVKEFKFEDRVFQSSASLERLIMRLMPVPSVKKGLFSNVPSLTYVDMSKWKQLTSVDYNAFGGVSLDELDLSEWIFPSLDTDLFSGASINTLKFQQAKIQKLSSGCFSNLQNSQNIDFASSELTSIDSGSFDNFSPLPNFELKIPSDMSCCNLEGLKELIASASNGIIINDNSQNYTCRTPQNNIVTIDIDTNKDPSLGLSCCDYSVEYFDTTNEICEKCTKTEFCSDSSDKCDGENSAFFICNTCDSGFKNSQSSSECQRCTATSDCLESSSACSEAPNIGNLLMCNKCSQEGFSPNEYGICEQCHQGERPNCVTFGTTCLPESQKMACAVCTEATQLIDGVCVTVEDNSLPLGIIIGASVAVVAIVGLISILAVGYALYRRKKRKQKKLNKICGITKNEAGVDIEPVEFNESDHIDYSKSSFPSPSIRGSFISASTVGLVEYEDDKFLQKEKGIKEDTVEEGYVDTSKIDSNRRGSSSSSIANRTRSNTASSRAPLISANTIGVDDDGYLETTIFENPRENDGYLDTTIWETKKETSAEGDGEYLDSVQMESDMMNSTSKVNVGIERSNSGYVVPVFTDQKSGSKVSIDNIERSNSGYVVPVFPDNKTRESAKSKDNYKVSIQKSDSGYVVPVFPKKEEDIVKSDSGYYMPAFPEKNAKATIEKSDSGYYMPAFPDANEKASIEKSDSGYCIPTFPDTDEKASIEKSDSGYCIPTFPDADEKASIEKSDSGYCIPKFPDTDEKASIEKSDSGYCIPTFPDAKEKASIEKSDSGYYIPAFPDANEKANKIESDSGYYTPAFSPVNVSTSNDDSDTGYYMPAFPADQPLERSDSGYVVPVFPDKSK